MKYVVFLCFMLVTLHLSAQEWEPYWMAAIEDCNQEDYLSAENNFNKTIDVMENEKDLEPSVYLDRARLYLILNRYEEALSDADKALIHENLNDKERIRAVSTRVAAKIKLGFSEGYDEDVTFLGNNLEMKVETTEDHLIIQNMPQDPIFRKVMTQFFVRIGICESDEDVEILSSDVCVVNKSRTSRGVDKRLGFDLQVERCRLWCDASAQSAISWCVNYPEFCLVNACNSAIFEIQNNCKVCCQTGFSQEFCAAPFSDILSVMQRILLTTGACR